MKHLFFLIENSSGKIIASLFDTISQWVINYPFFVTEIFIIYAILWGIADRISGMGLQRLFWHEEKWTQCFAGASIVILFFHIFGLSYLLDGGETCHQAFNFLNFNNKNVSHRINHHQSFLLSSTVLTLMCTIVAFIVPTVVLKRSTGPLSRVKLWPMYLGLLPGFGAIAVLAALNSSSETPLFLSPIVNYLVNGLERVDPSLKRLAVSVFLATTAVISTFSWLANREVTLGRFPVKRLASAAMSICMLLALLATALAYTGFNDPRSQTVLVTAATAVGLVCANVPQHKMRFPEINCAATGGSYYDNIISLKGYDDTRLPSKLLQTVAVLDNWRTRLEGSEGVKRPVIAVAAVSGGASRSAVWTAHVLDSLSRLPGFNDRLRLVAGASGGMVGASYYAALAGNNHPTHDIAKRLSRDCLSPIARHLIVHDLPFQFLPFRLSKDRGVVLEEAWRDEVGNELDVAFRDWADDEVDGKRPSLVFSPMTVEDGRRILISNLDLGFIGQNTGSYLINEDNKKMFDSKYDDVYSYSALEFFKLFPDATRFKVSTAARMSATFPYLSPAVALPTSPRLRVVDAGYYDNYGVNVAAAWVHQHREWIAANTSGVVLIQIRDSHSEYGRRESPRAERGVLGMLKRGTQEFTGPLAGAAMAREAVMAFRNDEQLNILSDWFRTQSPADPNFFATVVFEYRGDARLNWYLTQEERAEIQASLDDPNNRARFDLLEGWWRSRLVNKVDYSPRWSPDPDCWSSG